MELFADNKIQFAETNDVDAIVDLLNRAYRGDSSTKGWTTEAHLIAGDVRTNADAVKEVLQQEGSVILKYVDDELRIIGCVNLQQQEGKIYLGMFAVSPQLQGGGIGKQLLAAGEQYAKQQGCRSVFMTVISVRTELIDWYKRHGYVDTGDRKQFEEDGVSGRHLQLLDFALLEKQISK